jgi:SAM-dependent methyltransferase
VSITDQIRSFRKRRIDIAVDSSALVLDVGSGDKPHWRADVLLDRYIDAAFEVQRSGGRSARVDRPLFDADAADMPFADQAFDYVICSHMLEHVPDPAAVIAELVRVAKAGYIEVPEARSAKIVDFPSHLWWCSLDNGTLVFTAKTAPFFDADIDRFLDESGLRRPIADLLDRHLEHRVVSLHWRGGVAHRVDGSVSDEMLRAATTGEFHHRSGETLAARVMTGVLTVPLRGKRRRSPIRYDDVVRPSLRSGTDERLTAKVYRVEPR